MGGEEGGGGVRNDAGWFNKMKWLVLVDRRKISMTTVLKRAGLEQDDVKYLLLSC